MTQYNSDLPSDQIIKLLIEERRRRGDDPLQAELYALRHLKAVVSRMETTHPAIRATLKVRAETIKKYVVNK